ncbi:retrovirus-related pol polyprotein from transposon TNT 1-94 [Tanacetum coccineum]
MLYDGNVIAKETNVISIADSKETLMLEEESRSKMLLKQSDQMVLEKKVNTKPINFAKLNRLSEDFGKCFVRQRELTNEQALHPITDQSASSSIKIEALRELPKASLVNTSLKKLKYHLGQFDNVVKKRITPNALTKGEWGFKHTKAIFLNEIIPLLNTLKDISNVFDKDLLNDVTKILTIFNQMKATVQQYNIVNNVVNSSVDVNTSVKLNSSVIMNNSVNYEKMCNKCLELEAELIKQHNMTNTYVNQTEPSFDQLFELNNLKAELQAKDTTIKKLKAHIKRINETSTNKNMKKNFDEIETINIELEHREKVFVITTLKNELRKLKGKDIVDNVAQMLNAAIIAPGMYKLDPVILAPKNSDSKNVYNEHVKHPVKGAKALCSICNECLFDANHAICLIDHVNSMNVRAKSASKKNIKRKEWQRTRKVFNSVGCAKAFCSICNECLFDANHAMCLIDHVNSMNVRAKSASKKNIKRKEWRPKVPKSIQNSKPKVAKSMTVNRMKPGTFRGSDTSVAPSYSSLINCKLSKLFCDLEVAFRKHTCFVRNLEDIDLLLGSHGKNLYYLSIRDMMASSPICLLSKATKTKSWLWHRRLSHLNFSAINHLARHGLVYGLPRLKFEKDHLCSACAIGKSKKQSHKPKSEDTNHAKLYLLHMDLCGSILDIVVLFCLFDDQLTSLSPNNCILPDVLRLVSWQPT